MKTKRPLTPKQEAFCLAYLAGGNASEAYRRVYNAGASSESTVWKRACELLGDRKVTGRLAELRAGAAERAMINASDVLLEAMRIARFDIRKLYRQDGSPIPIHELDDETAASIQGVEVHEEYVGQGEDRVFVGYTKKYKIADKNAALEKLFKHFRLYERDRRQKTDLIRDLIASIAGNSLQPIPDSLMPDERLSRNQCDLVPINR